MRPPFLCKLAKGTLIDANPGFVDTFNWLVDFCNNICGDADLNSQLGIQVDKTVDDHPVVRLLQENISGGGGGGGGGTVTVSADGPFSPVYDEDGETVLSLTNCYWMNGGATKSLGTVSLPGTDGFIALKAGATTSTNGSGSVVCYSTLAAMQSDQEDPAYFIVPLYRVSSSKIVLDLRNIPHVYVGEIF